MSIPAAPVWLDLLTGQLVNAPSLPRDLTGCWDFALEAMDHGLVRWLPPEYTLETTATVEQVLDMLRNMVQPDAPSVGVVINNLRSGGSFHASTGKLFEPPAVLPVLPELVLRDPLTYTFPDICDAATMRQQHHAVYGAWLRRDLQRLELPKNTKTLTFQPPGQAPYIRWATRHPEFGHRLVYLVVGWDYWQDFDQEGLPIAWAGEDLWRGAVGNRSWMGSEPFDFLNPDDVAKAFGLFDLAEVNTMRVLAAKAHGWNKLSVPRAWEGVELPFIYKSFF